MGKKVLTIDKSATLNGTLMSVLTAFEQARGEFVIRGKADGSVGIYHRDWNDPRFPSE